MLGQRLGHIDMGGHGQRVHTRIGPASAMDPGRLSGHAVDRFFEALLDRRAMVLALPAY
jgi:hypothetical protein